LLFWQLFFRNSVSALFSGLNIGGYFNQLMLFFVSAIFSTSTGNYSNPKLNFDARLIEQKRFFDYSLKTMDWYWNVILIKCLTIKIKKKDDFGFGSNCVLMLFKGSLQPEQKEVLGILVR
jgi:hypothetical protein